MKHAFEKFLNWLLADGARLPTRAVEEETVADVEFEIYQDKKKLYRWRLRACNGKVVADSGQGYQRRRDVLRGVEMVKGSHDAYVAWDAGEGADT